MKQWGATLIFIGLGSFVLPMIGLQFRLLNLFGGSPAAGMFVAAVGGVLLAVGFMKERTQISTVAKPTDSGRQRQVTTAGSQPQSQPIKDAGIRCAACVPRTLKQISSAVLAERRWSLPHGPARRVACVAVRPYRRMSAFAGNAASPSLCNKHCHRSHRQGCRRPPQPRQGRGASQWFSAQPPFSQLQLCIMRNSNPFKTLISQRRNRPRNRFSKAKNSPMYQPYRALDQLCLRLVPVRRVVLLSLLEKRVVYLRRPGLDRRRSHRRRHKIFRIYRLHPGQPPLSRYHRYSHLLGQPTPARQPNLQPVRKQTFVESGREDNTVLTRMHIQLIRPMLLIKVRTRSLVRLIFLTPHFVEPYEEIRSL
jgi:hypothetical protein